MLILQSIGADEAWQHSNSMYELQAEGKGRDLSSTSCIGGSSIGLCGVNPLSCMHAYGMHNMALPVYVLPSQILRVARRELAKHIIYRRYVVLLYYARTAGASK